MYDSSKAAPTTMRLCYLQMRVRHRGRSGLYATDGILSQWDRNFYPNSRDRGGCPTNGRWNRCRETSEIDCPLARQGGTVFLMCEVRGGMWRPCLRVPAVFSELMTTRMPLNRIALNADLPGFIGRLTGPPAIGNFSQRQFWPPEDLLELKGIMQGWRVTTISVAAVLLLLMGACAICTLLSLHACTWISSSMCEPSQEDLPSHTRASGFHAERHDVLPEVNSQQPCILLLHSDVVRGLHRKHLRAGSLMFNQVVSACFTVERGAGAVVGKGSPNSVVQFRPAEAYNALRTADGTRRILRLASFQLPPQTTAGGSSVFSTSAWKEVSLEESAFYHSLLDDISRGIKCWSFKSEVPVSEPGEWRTDHTDDPDYCKDSSYQGSLAPGMGRILEAGSFAQQQLVGPFSQLTPTLHHRRQLMSLPARKHASHPWYIPGVTVGSIAVVSLCGVFFYISRKRLPDGSSKYVFMSCMNCNSRPANKIPGGKSPCVLTGISLKPLRVFLFKELEQATHKFSVKIGSGGFGEVFQGALPSGTLIAVKRGIPAANDTDGMTEMLKEIEILSALQHRNLVKLLGYCPVDTHFKKIILVYEYVPNGTLADHLYGILSQNVLSWADRLIIARDAARAIAYLHSGDSSTRESQLDGHKQTKISVIHRDIKPSNILLDANLRAKVGDFGISTVVPNMETHITTGPKGTTGYVDPLYQVSHQLTQKSDVYSFGIVLLELVSGRKAVDLTRAQEDWQVLLWCNKVYPAQGCEAVTDPRLQRGTYSRKSVRKILDCAILCCQQYGRDRPDMCRVLDMIDEAIRIHTTEKYYQRFDVDAVSSSPRSVISIDNSPPRAPPEYEVRVPIYTPGYSIPDFA